MTVRVQSVIWKESLTWAFIQLSIKRRQQTSFSGQWDLCKFILHMFEAICMYAFFFLCVAWIFYEYSSLCYTCWSLLVINCIYSSVQSLSRVWLFTTPWIAAHQASLSITNSWSSLRLMSIESVMPSSHLILGRPLFLLPLIPPSIRVFSNESTLHMR